MAGDRRATVGQPHQPPHDGEGVPGRPPLGRRHRRRRRAGHGDGEALPAPARALREGRGRRRCQPRGQGQPARPDGAQPPAGRHAGPRRRAAVRRLRPAPRRRAACSSTTSPAAATRRATSPPPARAACTPARSSSSATATALDRDRRRRPRHQGAVPGGRRGLGHRRSRPRAGHLPDHRHHHRRRLRRASPTTRSPSASAALLDRLAAHEQHHHRGHQPRRRRRAAPDEHAVLRRARAGDEGPGRLRPQGHRPRPQPSSPWPTTTASSSAPRTRRDTLRKVSEIYDRIAFAGRRQVQRVRPAAHRRASATPTSRATRSAARTSTPAAWPTSTPRSSARVFTHEMKPMEVEILVAEVGAEPGGDQLFHILYDGTVVDEQRLHACSAARPRPSPSGSKARLRAGPGPRRRAPRRGRGARRPRPQLGADDLEVAVLDRAGSRRAFRRLDRRRGRRAALGGERAGRAPRVPTAEPPRPRPTPSRRRGVGGERRLDRGLTADVPDGASASASVSGDAEQGHGRRRAPPSSAARASAPEPPCRRPSPSTQRRRPASPTQLAGDVQVVLGHQHVDRADAGRGRRRCPRSSHTMPSEPRRAAIDLGLERESRSRRAAGTMRRWHGAADAVPARPSHGVTRRAVRGRRRPWRHDGSVRRWSGASSASRTSTASPARSAASAGSAPTRSPATCSAGSCRWGRSSQRVPRPTAPASTSTSAATPSTPRPSATRSTTSSSTTRRGSASSSSSWRQRRAAPPRGGHPRRHLPVQEQHRLGRQLLRLPRELPHRARRDDFGHYAEVLIPFLVTRQIYAGAGKVLQTARGAMYCISQRAEHIWEGVSSATTRSRPIINTRDEPHADAERYRRLHVIVGDSNMSEYATFLKVGATSILLRMLEDPSVVLRDMTLENPIRAIREISHDITCRRAGPPGQRPRGRRALEIQAEYLNRALRYAETQGPQPARGAGARDVGALPDRARERPAQARPRGRLGHQVPPDRGVPRPARPAAHPPEGRADRPRSTTTSTASAGLFYRLQARGLVERMCTDDDIDDGRRRRRRRPPGPGCGASSSAGPRSASATTRSTGCT